MDVIDHKLTLLEILVVLLDKKKAKHQSNAEEISTYTYQYNQLDMSNLIDFVAPVLFRPILDQLNLQVVEANEEIVCVDVVD
jgi:hypothetical protein